jgi:replicative DNA helicase
MSNPTTQKEYEDKLLSSITSVDHLNNLIIKAITSDSFLCRREVFDFYQKYKNKYSNIPSKAIVEANFPDFKVLAHCKEEEVDFFIDELKKSETKRRARKILEKGAELNESDPYGALDYLLSKLPTIRKLDDYTRGYTDKEAMKRFDIFKERKELALQGVTAGIKTGLSVLDDKQFGWERGNLIVIIASPKVGKTTLAMYLAAYAYVMDNCRVLYLQPEMSKIESEFRWDPIVGRLMGYKFSNLGLAMGKKDVNEEKYREFLRKVAEREDWLTLTSSDRKPFTVSSIEAEVDRFNPDVVVMDSFLAIRSGDKDWQDMIDTASGLKNIAQSKNNVMIITSQPTRAVKPGEMPKVTEVYGGEALRQQCDVMMTMCDTEEVKTKEIAIPLIRSRPVSNKRIKLTWDIDAGNIGI